MDSSDSTDSMDSGEDPAKNPISMNDLSITNGRKEDDGLRCMIASCDGVCAPGLVFCSTICRQALYTAVESRSEHPASLVIEVKDDDVSDVDAAETVEMDQEMDQELTEQDYANALKAETGLVAVSIRGSLAMAIG